LFLPYGVLTFVKTKYSIPANIAIPVPTPTITQPVTEYVLSGPSSTVIAQSCMFGFIEQYCAIDIPDKQDAIDALQ
jgi:hypothetical protein